MKDATQFHIRPARLEEAGLFYTPHPEEDKRLGTVGHVRMDFGRSGNEFWHTWWPRGPEELNSPTFKLELQEVVDTLRESVLKCRRRRKNRGQCGRAAAGRAGGDIRECGCRSGKLAYVACCGTSIQPVLERLRQNPKLNMVYLCLDNDEAGEDACESMMEVLADMDVDVERLRPQGKDWNDDLCAKRDKAKTPTA